MLEKFKRQIQQDGYFIFHDFLSKDLVDRMAVDLDRAYIRCRRIQLKNGLDNTEATAHHLIGQGDSFMECLAEYEHLNEYFEWYFGGKYILNSFGGNLLKKSSSYANSIHRDIRSFSAHLPLMLNTIVFLDDFTPENGATWLMHRGHEWINKPTDAEFDDYKFQITGRAGSIAVWNSNLWHKAGVNTTKYPRRSVTPELSKPFYKQGFDYSQFATEGTSEYLKQVLGYYSRTPHCLSEWYQKPEKRFYRSNQG